MSAAFHLAVDAHDLARDERGIGVYVRALARRFARRDDLRLTLVVRDVFPGRAARWLRTAIDAPHVAVTNRVPRDADLVWHPFNGTFLPSRNPSIATIHDVAPFAFPSDEPRRRTSQQEPFRRTAASARAMLCDSQFTADEAARYLAVERARFHVVPLGVDADFSPGAPDALPAALRGRHYVLHVGAHDAHKNVATLVAGYRRAFGGSDMAIVFTRSNAEVPEALAFANVDTPTLIALYRGATFVAVPSLYEGFGLPVLEAMACGAPALVARAASLPEVGGDAVRYVETPADPQAWAAALRMFAENPSERAEFARRGRARAAAFTWERCADATLAVMRATAERA